MNRKRGLNAYQTNQTRNRAQSASPYRLVQMMYENLLDSLAKARGGVEREDTRLRGENIGRAHGYPQCPAQCPGSFCQ